jgi:uncharacterized protein
MSKLVPPSLQVRAEACQRPARKPVMYQSWQSLLFLHWTIDPQIVQASLPPGLHVDTFQGQAYVAVVPFLMRNIRPRFAPAVPGISNFLELNLRTYVFSDGGVPGVWFFSLDANQALAVWLAQKFFHLPYTNAKMTHQVDSNGLHQYRTQRVGCVEESTFSYRPQEALPPSSPTSLEYFLLERYILFAYDAHRGKIYSGQVHHQPYRLQRVEVEACEEWVSQQAGLPHLRSDPSHAIMSPGVDVEVFGLQAA